MSKHGRILVIDDDENIRKALTMTLEGQGYRVEGAKDGKEAIEKSNSSFYNLALIDIRLPDMEGTALLSDMRDTTPRMVKIIITGYPSLDNAAEAANRGADGYIVKPVKTEQLLSMIEEHLGKQQEELRYSERKVAEYIETRAREHEAVERRR